MPAAGPPFSLREITYEEIRSFWATHLWPDNPTSLRPVSSMLFEGGYDPSINERIRAVYFGIFVNCQLLGVNSGHFTSRKDYRSRGLCVLPGSRRLGYGQALLEAMVKRAREDGAARIWSYPRESAWPIYEKAGFRLTNRRLRENDPNQYAFLEIPATFGEERKYQKAT